MFDWDPSAWLLLESLSAGILFATFVEIIFAAQYQLQARGYAIFQGVKVLLWTAIVVVCVAAASAETRGWEGALVVLLIGVLVL